jgi:aminopeptidase N
MAAPHPVQPSAYALEISPAVDADGVWSFTGVCAIDVEVTAADDAVVHLQCGDDIVVHGATVDGAPAATARPDALALCVEGPSGPLGPGPHRVVVHYSSPVSTNMAGFYVSKAGPATVLSTQFESSDAPRAFPCFDDPTLKARFAVTLDVPPAWTAVSNMPVASVVPGSVAGWARYVFPPTPPMSTYLVGWAMGDLEESPVETTARYARWGQLT